MFLGFSVQLAITMEPHFTAVGRFTPVSLSLIAAASLELKFVAAFY